MTDEELLDTRRRAISGRRRTLLGGAAVLVLAGALTGLVIVQRHTGHSSSPSPSPSISPSAPDPKIVSPAAGDAAPVVAGDQIFALLGGTLLRASLTTAGAATALPGATSGDGDDYQLLADAARSRLWLVRLQTPSVLIAAFDSRSLRPLGAVSRSGQATGAALLDGRLYVATDQGLITISTPTGGDLRSFASAQPQVIAADPTRHRLVVLTEGTPAKVTILGVGQPSTAAPFGKGDLVVVDGQIWAGGYGAHGAVLVRLDPSTLRPGRHSPLEPQLGPGAQLVGAGAHDFLVRSGAGGGALWCVDAHSGAAVHTWPELAGPVALSRYGVFGFSADGASVEKFDSGACVG